MYFDLASIQIDFGKILPEFDKDKLTIYAVDTPGYGQSRPPEKVFNDYYRVDAELIMKLMNHLGVDKYSAMGFSEGGRVALWMAGLDHQNKIDKLAVWGCSNSLLDKEKNMLKGKRLI